MCEIFANCELIDQIALFLIYLANYVPILKVIFFLMSACVFTTETALSGFLEDDDR